MATTSFKTSLSRLQSDTLGRDAKDRVNRSPWPLVLILAAIAMTIILISVLR